jgi:putative transcriptional regulator
MDSLQGHLLIASQELLDPNFAKTVVLIAVHGEEGALGLILNREMPMPISQIWSQLSESTCMRQENAWHGGPVTGSLMALHDQPPMGNIVINQGLFVATELSAMELLAASDEGQVRFYVGHSGWGPGQLENEIGEGSWLVMPAAPEHVFHKIDSTTLWKNVMVEVGRRQIQSVVPIRFIPDNPSAN